MSNNVYDRGFYNDLQKSRYLKGLPKNTYETYGRILRRASYLEKQYDKDLYEFDINEIKNLLNFLNAKTLNSIAGSVSIIQNYISWAIEEGLRSNNLNPLDAIFGDEFFRKFVDTSSKILFSYQDIMDIVDGLVNPQDTATILCLWEGIMGRRYSELLNLSKQDLMSDKELIVKNDISETEQHSRIITINNCEELVSILREAANQDIYIKNNGRPGNIKAPEAKLINNEYVFRPSILNIKDNGKAESHLVIRRIRAIAKLVNEPYLTAINIRNSGMLYMAYNLYKKNGKLRKLEIDTVCEHFNVSKLKGGKSYNNSRLKKEFLNIETINKVYEE